MILNFAQWEFRQELHAMRSFKDKETASFELHHLKLRSLQRRTMTIHHLWRD